MVKGFVISAPRSGEGKTLLTLGILRLLTLRGFRVQPFKVGPDYIDTKWQAQAAGKPSYNLDLFSMGEERVKALFYHKSKDCDFSVVEGVMGLFDGRFSTFKLAGLLGLPIILVLDTSGVAETISYILKGLAERIKKAGLELFIFLNRVSSHKHLLRLERALKGYQIIGHLFRKRELELPSRHLGLYLPEHLKEAEDLISTLAYEIERSFDLSVFKPIPNPPEESPLPRFFPELPFQRLAIALDPAFNFYYQHVLDEISQKLEPLFFSPLEDSGLPTSAQALYLGGGYPELFARRLSENKGMLREIKAFAEDRFPIYAECGGLVYLSKGLFWEDKFYPLAGIFPFEVSKKGLALGYRRVKLLARHPFMDGLKEFYAHEFHYTQIENTAYSEKIYKVYTPENENFYEGFRYKNVLASYLHFIAVKEN
jgi:cobyrinic acid a,c-diamide synthase